MNVTCQCCLCLDGLIALFWTGPSTSIKSDPWQTRFNNPTLANHSRKWQDSRRHQRIGSIKCFCTLGMGIDGFIDTNAIIDCVYWYCSLSIPLFFPDQFCMWVVCFSLRAGCGTNLPNLPVWCQIKKKKTCTVLPFCEMIPHYYFQTRQLLSTNSWKSLWNVKFDTSQ